MSSDLVERVARAMTKADGYDEDDPADYEFMNKMARAAIAVVLEEAADAVGEVGDHAEVGVYINAVRALIPK